MYIPYLVRSKASHTGYYEAFYCLIGFELLRFLLVGRKPEAYASLAVWVSLSMDLILFAVELMCCLLSRMGLGGKGRVMPWDFWAWCRPQHEQLIKEALNSDLIFFEMGVSAMMNHYWPILGPPFPTDKYSDSPFHVSALLFTITRLAALSGTIVLANLRKLIFG